MSGLHFSAAEAAGFLEPLALRKVRETIRTTVTGVTEQVDRRGFRLLHWRPRRETEQGKPCELSLEHEARLVPSSASDVDRLLDAFYGNLGKPVAGWLTSNDSSLADLHLRAYERAPGPQSADQYYDTSLDAAAWTIIPRGMTVRKRVATSSFMTWAGGVAPDVAPLNLELPSVALGAQGLTARLEFNWLDDLELSLRQSRASSSMAEGNPLALASQLYRLPFPDLCPALHHTTHRQKFGFAHSDGAERFVVNVDLMVAQSLASRRMAVSCDVDISSVRLIDAEELAALSEFTGLLAHRFALRPASGTKAWSDALALGLRENLQ
jgi:hypothetical protein